MFYCSSWIRGNDREPEKESKKLWESSKENSEKTKIVLFTLQILYVLELVMKLYDILLHSRIKDQTLACRKEE